MCVIIARDDRSTVERFGNLILSKVTTLETFPRIGRIVPEFREDRLREIIMSPYRILFEIDDRHETVAILRIWHGARGELSFSEES